MRVKSGSLYIEVLKECSEIGSSPWVSDEDDGWRWEECGLIIVIFIIWSLLRLVHRRGLSPQMHHRFRGIAEKIIDVYLPHMGWDQEEVLIERLYGLNPSRSKLIGYIRDASK